MSEAERVAMIIWNQKRKPTDPPWNVLSTLRPEVAEEEVKRSTRKLERTDRMIQLFDGYTTITPNRDKGE